MLWFDSHSTMPCSDAVIEAMAPWLRHRGHPASPGLVGDHARKALAVAADQIRQRAGAEGHRVVFTSGATEANNLAIASSLAPGDHAIAAATEHKAVLEPLAYSPAAVTLLPVGTDGRLAPKDLKRALRPNTKLVCAMAVNNESGVMHNLQALAEVCHEAAVPLHTDAAQLAFQSPDLGAASLITLSAHKLGGPPGIGALLATPGIELTPQIYGGEQQQGTRSGTLPVALIVGMGVAASSVADGTHIATHRDALVAKLQANVPGFRLIGSTVHRAPQNLYAVLPGVDTQLLISLVSHCLQISTGSACQSGSAVPSHVAVAMGIEGRALASTVRIGLPADVTASQIQEASDLLAHYCSQARG